MSSMRGADYLDISIQSMKSVPPIAPHLASRSDIELSKSKARRSGTKKAIAETMISIEKKKNPSDVSPFLLC